jgi:hypothetical protein
MVFCSRTLAFLVWLSISAASANTDNNGRTLRSFSTTDQVEETVRRKLMFNNEPGDGGGGGGGGMKEGPLPVPPPPPGNGYPGPNVNSGGYPGNGGSVSGSQQVPGSNNGGGNVVIVGSVPASGGDAYGVVCIPQGGRRLKGMAGPGMAGSGMVGPGMVGNGKGVGKSSKGMQLGESK